MTHMKKVCMMLLGVLLITACTNEKEADIVYELTAQIDLLNVVKGQKSIDNTDVFPGGRIDISGYNVRVNYFVYNDEGSLVASETKIVGSFAQTVSVVKSLPGGNYTLVATADIVKSVDERVDFEFWKFENVSRLRDFRIVDQNYIGYEFKSLGIVKQYTLVDGAKQVNLSVKPVGSLVTFYFQNVYLNNVAIVYYEWNKTSDYYSVDDETSNIRTVRYGFDYEVDSQYTGFYDQRYFLPIQGFKFLWGIYDADLELLDFDAVTFNITKGINPTVTVDVSTGSMQVTTSTRSATVGACRRIDALNERAVLSSSPQLLEVDALPYTD